MGRILDFWRTLNAPCRSMARLASESLDRDLAGAERIALRSHLIYCRACRLYSRQIEALHRALRDLAPLDPSTGVDPGIRNDGNGLPDEVRERIKRRLNGG